jgi:hypothetical protein
MALRLRTDERAVAEDEEEEAREVHSPLQLTAAPPVAVSEQRSGAVAWSRAPHPPEDASGQSLYSVKVITADSVTLRRGGMRVRARPHTGQQHREEQRAPRRRAQQHRADRGALGDDSRDGRADLPGRCAQISSPRSSSRARGTRQHGEVEEHAHKRHALGRAWRARATVRARGR